MSRIGIEQRTQGETLKVSRSHAPLGVRVHFMEAVPSFELLDPGTCLDILGM